MSSPLPHAYFPYQRIYFFRYLAPLISASILSLPLAGYRSWQSIKGEESSSEVQVSRLSAIEEKIYTLKAA